ncbi:MAG: 3'(2'),5'-bisphosphate nucleotidase CysQ [Pseudorhodobacter sp.]
MPEREADDLALLTAAARAAGEVALRFWKRDYAIRDKGQGEGPVTEADLAVDARLAEILREARPDYGWLSEESPEHGRRGTARRCFIIDPIDGTRAFIAGQDTFSHSLAVVEAGRVVAGVVYLPALDRLYAASVGGVALRNGAVISASARAGIEGARVLSPKSNFSADHWPGGVPDVALSFRPSLAFRLCLVAEGRHDGMLTLRPAWDWDIAAGALIAARAGAVVTDAAGGQIVFNAADPRSPGVIAAAPGLHAALLQRRMVPSA